MNPDLLTADYGEDAGRLWAKSRLLHRIEAIVVHELAEFEAGDHEEALTRAAETALPISRETREILRAMALGWRGRGR